jgi:long-subunit fatty acid transport protein
MGTRAPDLTVRQFGLPGAPRAATSAAYLLEDAARGLGIDIPPEYRAGIWAAPYRRMRLEGDVAFTQWARAGWYRPREQPLCGAPCSTLLRRDWRNTVSPRIGLDIDVAEHLQVIGGFAFDPSPLRAPARDGAFLTPAEAAGLSTYAGGITYDFARGSFDVGYSFHRAGRSQDISGGQLSSNSHVWAVSVRWRL